MKLTWYNILVTVLLTSTVAVSIYLYTMSQPVNSSVEFVLDTPLAEEIPEVVFEDPILLFWGPEQGKTSTFEFHFLNRELPSNWEGKKLYLKYTFVGKYTEGIENEINELLENEYSWKNQLDKNGNVVFGGPLLLKDGTYQFYTHNTLYLAQKHFLLGDILHYLSNQNTLVGTEIEVGGLKLEGVWEKDIDVVENNKILEEADFIMSTCLERNGSKRLVVGFNVIE